MELMAHIVKYNSQATGREKLCRLVQYTSKFTKWYIGQKAGSEEFMHRLKLLENALSSSRKVMRFGKSLDMIQGALKSMTQSDYFLRLCLVSAKLTQACYLLLDHYIWMGKTGIITVDSKKWGPRAARFWLTILTLNILRDIYDIVTAIDNASRRQRRQKSGSPQGVATLKAVMANTPLMMDTAKNVCDVFLPLSILGYINVSPGFEGIMGIISSIMGIIPMWNPTYKLTPS